jgi:transcriptional regulator with XRE-family HTH domain
VVRPGRRRRAESRYAEQAERLAAGLRVLREQAGMSQEQLAARAEVSVATVRKIETVVVVEPGYFTVLAMLRVLGATTEQLSNLSRAGDGEKWH